jgi:hypothetical protein
VEANDAWVAAQVAANPKDSYWYHVNLITVQLRAMVAGYNSVAPAAQAMSYTAYLSASLSGDLDDLCAPGMFNCTKVASGSRSCPGSGPLGAPVAPHPSPRLPTHPFPSTPAGEPSRGGCSLQRALLPAGETRVGRGGRRPGTQ